MNNKISPLREAYHAEKQRRVEVATAILKERVMTFSSIAEAPQTLKPITESIIQLEEVAETLADPKAGVDKLSQYLNNTGKLLEMAVNSKNAEKFELALLRYTAVSEFLRSNSIASCGGNADTLFESWLKTPAASLLDEDGVVQFKEAVEQLSKLSKKQAEVVSRFTPKMTTVLSERTMKKIVDGYLLLEQEEEELLAHAQQLNAVLGRLEKVSNKLPAQFEGIKKGLDTFSDRFDASIAGDSKQVAVVVTQAENFVEVFKRLGRLKEFNKLFRPLAKKIENADEGSPAMSDSVKAFETQLDRFFIAPVIANAKKKKGPFQKLLGRTRFGTPDFPPELSPEVIKGDILNLLKRKQDVAAVAPQPPDEEGAAAPTATIPESKALIKEGWEDLVSAMEALAGTAKAAPVTTTAVSAVPGRAVVAPGKAPSTEPVAQAAASPPAVSQTIDQKITDVAAHLKTLSPVDRGILLANLLKTSGLDKSEITTALTAASSSSVLSGATASPEVLRAFPPTHSAEE